MRRVLSALPVAFGLAAADATARAGSALPSRWRRVARENLRAVLGEALDPEEAGHLARAAFRVRARAAFLGAQDGLRRKALATAWLEVPPAVASGLGAVRARGGLLVSARLGPWPWLCEAPTSLGLPPAVLADRAPQAGEPWLYAAFLGLPAPTSAVPAQRVLAAGGALVPVFCVPAGRGRSRLWAGPDLTATLPGTGADDARVRALTARVNHVVGAVVRACPEAFDWTSARFASRPTIDLGPYPAYSRYRPEAAADAPAPAR